MLDAGLEGTGSVFMGADGSNSRVYNAVTNSLWFSRFMQGYHKRMEDLNFPDKAVDIYIIRGCFDVGQCMWDKNEFDNYAQCQVAMTMCIVISGYFGGLQGEEIVKADKGAMLKCWIKSVSHKGNLFVPLMLVERFKRVTGEMLFCQPLAYKTNNGRRLDTWFGRLFSCFKKSGTEQVPLFSTSSGKGMTITEMDVLFHKLLKEGQ